MVIIGEYICTELKYSCTFEPEEGNANSFIQKANTSNFHDITMEWHFISISKPAALFLFFFAFFWHLHRLPFQMWFHLNIEVILFIKLPNKSERPPPPTLISVSLLNGNGTMGLVASRISSIGIFGLDFSKGTIGLLYLFGSGQ